ncbi:MAG: hypothetical protein ROZ00_04870 [Denitratisoma sp.]|nr:hypothetical protein [Denitratisoma sp.]
MTAWPDIVNGSFEAAAGIAVINHCFALWRDKEVRGLSVASVAFFAAWGVWNLFYYPHLDQFYSFAGGVFITFANAIYVAMLVHFTGGWRDLGRRIRERLAGWTVCPVAGCRYNASVLRLNTLYFCRRCGKEIAGRTFADLEPMSAEDIEEMHREIEMGARP